MCIVHFASISILIDIANIQNKGRALLSNKIDNTRMTKTYDIDAMRIRLSTALENSGISERAASLKANASPGYVHSIVKGDADPGTSKLAEICRANGISFSYVLFGFEMSPETEELVALFEAKPEHRDNILALIKS